MAGMKRQTARTAGIFLVLMMAFSLGACDSVKRAVSGGKKAPDEFAVYKRPPLSLPPDYALRPPEPGREQLETFSPRDQARAAILRRPVQAQPLAETTPGLTVLMDKMGTADADPAIRTIVDRETLALSEEDRRLIDKLIFWVDDPKYAGTVVDPAAEQRRLLETQALGKPVNEGKTPEVKRETRRKGILGF
tara:strand:+ start:146 stop:721 length:576 start_codon:yes stop_codon:yes gene_type:complete